MKLEGSLDAFSLPDVFQLLSYTKKTGGLHLAHDGCDGVVYFASGEVTGASADGSRHPLARRLIGAGSVEDDALRAAVERVEAGEGLGVAKALLESGSVDAELLRRAAQEQSVDAVFDLLRWREGDFAFVLDEANPDDVGFAAPASNVLEEAEGRRGTWDTVSRVVPSPDAVLSMPVVLAEDPAINRDDWALLALVDGRRTVAQLVDLAGCGQYAVVSTLAALVERGLLAVSETAGDHASVVARRQALLAPLEQTFVPVSAPVPLAEAVAVAPDVPAGLEPVADDAGEPASSPAPEPDAPVGHEQPPGGQDTPDTTPADVAEPDEPAVAGAVASLGGAHVPGDVVPPRPEPFLPRRQADFDDEHRTADAVAMAPTAQSPVTIPAQVGSSGGGEVVGATALALDPNAPIERDPSVNRSLMLRLIAGVRGL